MILIKKIIVIALAAVVYFIIAMIFAETIFRNFIINKILQAIITGLLAALVVFICQRFLREINHPSKGK
jgi:VIT1/CCC1 family predicted Fe2+/Mn2+ transporter